jgi:hypothetical protein
VNRTLVVFALLATAACTKDRQKPPPPPVPPTLAEADAFAKEFAKMMVPCERIKLQAVLDSEQLVARALAGRDFPSAELEGFKKGFRSSAGNKICDGIVGKTTYTYLRTPMVDGTPRPLFRMLGDNGLNYHQLELDKRTGTIKIADIYIYALGEPLSHTLGEATQMMLDSDGDSALARVPGIQRLIASGDQRGALAAIEALPPRMRKVKMMMALEVIATSGGDAKRQSQAADAYANAFPNDPSLDLIRFDDVMTRMQYGELLAMLDRLDKRLGGDPYLDALRAQALNSSGKHAEAITAAKRAIAAEPGLEDAYWGLLAPQVASKDFAGAVATVKVLRDRFAADTAALQGDPRFAPLVDSKEYAAWMKQ